MMFVSPLFLWALAAVLLPIIIHLFNFRRYKKVYFTNVKFLKELQQESKSKSRLKEILVLLARCLAIICLVLAFAQPVIPSKNATRKMSGINALSLYIDNSFSMENVNKQGALLDIAKTRAKEVIQVFDNADKFQIVTNDFEGKHQRFYTKEDVLNAIDEIKISSAVRDINDVLKRQSDFLNSSGTNNKKIYLFSDAQRSTFNVESLEIDTMIKVNIIPLQANQVNNVYIDTCWFETPLQQKGFIQKLHAKIVNNGNSNIDAGSVKLYLNKQQIAIASFSLDANSKTEVLFTFECKQSGFNFGSVKIEDYPITFDDELFFAFNSKVNIAVSLVNGRNQSNENSFSALFKSDSLFDFRFFSEQTIDYGAFKNSDVIILNQLSELSSGLVSELLKFTEQGGAIVIVPNEKLEINSYNEAMKAFQLSSFEFLDTSKLKVEKIELASGFYSGVFGKIDERMNLPVVNKHFKFLKSGRNNLEAILILQNADDFLSTSKFNNTALYLFSSPINESATNFGKHALFVPTMYRICFSSLKSVPLFYTTNTNVVINLKNDLSAQEQPPHIKAVNGNIDIIPEMRIINNALSLFTRNQISQPDFYEVSRNNVSLQPLAFNFSRKESDLSSYSFDEIRNIISEKGYKNVSLIEDTGANISAQVLQIAEGKKLWKLFLLLTLLFIAIEAALLRLLK